MHGGNRLEITIAVRNIKFDFYHNKAHNDIKHNVYVNLEIYRVTDVY